MRGLLIKDCKLILAQKNFCWLLLVCALFIISVMEEGEGVFTFIIGYIALLVLMMFLGTVSYDEFDNGYSFLFTLPVSRKEYVLEKYVLCMIGSLGSGMIVSIAGMAITAVRQSDIVAQMILQSVCILAACMAIMALMLPIMLKYGPDKLRTISFLITGVIVGAGIALSKISIPEGSVLDVSRLVNVMETLGETGITLIAVLLAIVAVVISFYISVRIMEKKEF